jgi:myo-inosose-2 dehydratase
VTVRIGTNPIGWSNDDLRELGGETPLETCLSEARSAGFDGIELGHKFPRDAEVLGPILDRHHLVLVSGWYSCGLLQRDAAAELNAMRPHMTLLRALGCEVLILAETSNAIHGDRAAPLSGRPVLAERQWPMFANRLTDLADAAAVDGLSIAYHHHMGTVVQSEAEIDRLMAMTGPNLTLLLDTGHATFAGADPVGLALRHRARITHVHCKDVRAGVMAAARRDDRSFLDSVVDGVFTVPGDGDIDFTAVLAALPGYASWLVVEAEQDPAKAHPLTYARMGHDNVEGFAKRAGLI